MNDDKPLLRLSRVSKRCGDRLAVDDVSLDVARGGVVALVGPSGCGKTTTLRLIAGLDTPDAGEIWLDGMLASAPGRVITPPHQRGIGFVFQDLALWPHLTVGQHLEFVLGSLRLSQRERTSRIGEMLALVRIADMAGRRPHQLSGGEQQRVALARALVSRPRLVLLDEPFSSLDGSLRKTLQDEVLALRRALNLTMIVVTHERDDARTLGSRSVGMEDGRIVCTGL